MRTRGHSVVLAVSLCVILLCFGCGSPDSLPLSEKFSYDGNWEAYLFKVVWGDETVKVDLVVKNIGDSWEEFDGLYFAVQDKWGETFYTEDARWYKNKGICPRDSVGGWMEFDGLSLKSGETFLWVVSKDWEWVETKQKPIFAKKLFSLGQPGD